MIKKDHKIFILFNVGASQIKGAVSQSRSR